MEKEEEKRGLSQIELLRPFGVSSKEFG